MQIFIFIMFLLAERFINVIARPLGGVYAYVNRYTGEAHYIGATNNFDRRHNEHKYDKKYFAGKNYEMKKTYMADNAERRYSEEKKQINKYKPIANKYAGGNGRR